MTRTWRAGLLLPLLALLTLLPSARGGDEERTPLDANALEVRRLPSEWWRQTGRAFRFGDADKPAVLFFHGLNRDVRTWTAPGDDDGIPRYVFREPAPTLDLGRRSYLGAGVYKIGINRDREDANESNWFDYLAAQGCTVAAFSQKLPTFADAMTTVEEVWPKFLEESARMNPQAPPPIALVGHSRGGLVLRELIKRHPESMGRVKWVVTLHSPHAGSALAAGTEPLENEIRETIGELTAAALGLPDEFPIPAIRDELADAAVAALRPLLRMAVTAGGGASPEDLELAPDSPLIRGLAQGETALPGAKYLTFGGTDPNYFRFYVWWFTEGSATPHFSKKHGMYFKWKAVPREIDPISPMYAKLRDIAPEITPGRGDGLVADARSRLPWSTHTTLALNHSEPLWNRQIQGAVARALVGPRFRDDVPILMGAPGEDDSESSVAGQPASQGGRKTKKGGGLDSIPIDTGSVKATETADTAIAIRGRPASESVTREVDALLDDVAKRLESIDARVAAMEKQVGGGGAPGPDRGTPPGGAAGEEKPGGAAPGTSPGGAGAGTKPGLNLKDLKKLRPGLGAAGELVSKVRNAALKGRLGRLVARFPEGSESKDEVQLYADGETEKCSKWAAGGLEVELIPGRYAVVVHKKRIEGVEIATGHDTVVRLGVIRVQVGKGTEWSLFEPGSKECLTWGNDEKSLGVVPGRYEIEINKKREAVEVGPGETVDF